MTLNDGVTEAIITNPNAVIYPADLVKTAFDTVSLTEAGEVVAWDLGVVEFTMSFTVRANATLRGLIETIYENVGRHTAFTLTPDDWIDLGNGAGTAVTARFWMNSLQCKMIAYDFYEIPIAVRIEG